MPAGNPANQERGLDGLLFQSLFSWMPAGNTLNRWRRLNMRWSFNPCSRGCLPETRRTESSMSLWPRFQSLFSWMPAGNDDSATRSGWRTMVSILVLVDACRKHEDIGDARGSPGCFNPCSRGCLPETRHLLFRLHGHQLFQSLFSWMPAGNSATIGAYLVRHPVSILVLVDACRKPMVV